MAKTISDYFQEGQKAHRDGQPKSANPYVAKANMDDAESNWDEGWDSEQKAAYGQV